MKIMSLSFRVPPCGIEPQPSEPESEILSIKLRRRIGGKYSEKPRPEQIYLISPGVSPGVYFLHQRSSQSKYSLYQNTAF